ncbi:MAG TPA: hypothetical protein VFK44_07135 [Bacillales bacterium]|nr:hypothetical protein [Bacillales bacterium]
MYDEMFKDLMEEQKRAYEQMPLQSSTDRIMRSIEMSRRKRKKHRNYRRMLPIAASLAAALLISALTLSQVISEPMRQGIENESSQHELKEKSVRSTDPGTDTEHTPNPSTNDEEDDDVGVGDPGPSAGSPETMAEAKAAFASMKAQGANQQKIDEAFVAFLISRQGLAVSQQPELDTLAQQWQTTFDSPEQVLAQSDRIKDPDFRDMIEKIKEQGLGLIEREGSLELIVPYSTYSDSFSAYLSPTMNQYLDLRANEVVLRDGSFSESWNALGENVLNTELFLMEHENFAFVAQLKNAYSRYLGIYLFGLPNTTPFDRNTQRLTDEAKRSYEKIIAENPNSTTAGIVKSYYEALQANGWKALQPGTFEMPSLPDELNPMQTYMGQDILSMPKALAEVYAQLEAAESEAERNKLSAGLDQSETFKLFLHAAAEKDYKLEYEFFINGSEPVPSLEDFLKNTDKLETFTNKVQTDLVKLDIMGQAGNVFARLYFKGEIEPHLFNMNDGKGVWKIEWNGRYMGDR